MRKKKHSLIGPVPQGIVCSVIEQLEEQEYTVEHVVCTGGMPVPAKQGIVLPGSKQHYEMIPLMVVFFSGMAEVYTNGKGGVESTLPLPKIEVDGFVFTPYGVSDGPSGIISDDE